MVIYWFLGFRKPNNSENQQKLRNFNVNLLMKCGGLQIGLNRES